MLTLLCIGFVLEALGIGLTALGLHRTWRANANGRDFLAPWARRRVEWVKYVLLRRERPTISVTANLVLSGVEMAARGMVYTDVREDMTIE